MGEKRCIGDLPIGEHVTIGGEEWKIIEKGINDKVVLEKVGSVFNKPPEVHWFRWPGVKRELLEAPYWYGQARDRYGAKIVEEMVPDKAYLYQLYSTCFLEFDLLEAAKSYYDERKREDPYFDIDPVTIIDTHDPEARKRWKGHMKKEASHD